MNKFRRTVLPFVNLLIFDLVQNPDVPDAKWHDKYSDTIVIVNSPEFLNRLNKSSHCSSCTFRSFLRRLNNHGFQSIKQEKGVETSPYYITHKDRLLRRSNHHLLKNIKRKSPTSTQLQKKRNARKKRKTTPKKLPKLTLRLRFPSDDRKSAPSPLPVLCVPDYEEHDPIMFADTVRVLEEEFKNTYLEQARIAIRMERAEEVGVYGEAAWEAGNTNGKCHDEFIADFAFAAHELVAY